MKLQLTVGAQLTHSFTREIKGLADLEHQFAQELEQDGLHFRLIGDVVWRGEGPGQMMIVYSLANI